MPDGVVKLKKQETVEMKTNTYNSITKVTIFIFIHNRYTIRNTFFVSKKTKEKRNHIEHDNELFAWCRNEDMV